MIPVIIGLVFILIGGALIETPIIGYLHGENDVGSIVFCLFCGLVFLVPGVGAVFLTVREAIRKRWHPDLKKILEALKPGFKEAAGDSILDSKLLSFREHYSAFFGKEHTSENEEIQKDVTQIFRNIMQFRKNRLDRLGLTCEMQIRRMAYTEGNGIKTVDYSDGKYDITDVTEEVAARTVYKKNGQAVYTKTDKETANYTVIQAKQTGDDTLICPNCGAETTRQALLDGCDYCGTKFTVEDLESCIAAFAFRPDEKLRAEKHRRTINRTWIVIISAAVLTVFIGFAVYAVKIFPELLETADGGIILTLLASIFGTVVASPVYIISYILVYPERVLPVLAAMGLISFFAARAVRAKKSIPMLSRKLEETVRETDPNFSMAYFYSGLQNKLASILYAENREQINAFAQGDLAGLLGKYSDVIGMDVDHMDLTGFSADDRLQHADVTAFLILTRSNGGRCRVKRETMRVRLIKDASCKTQAVCAPTVMKCSGCGASLDLLQGKHCAYCGRELDLSRYDWVIQDIRV